MIFFDLELIAIKNGKMREKDPFGTKSAPREGVLFRQITVKSLIFLIWVNVAYLTNIEISRFLLELFFCTVQSKLVITKVQIR